MVIAILMYLKLKQVE